MKRKPLNACYGRLTVVDRESATRVTCVCSCGSGPRSYRAASLRSGNTSSCGCLAKERQAEVGHSLATHGMSGTSIYKTWAEMRSRCSNPENKSYPRYGGRGIAVCARWDKSFEAFLADMGDRPSPTSTLDRIDNDGNYEPGNCRWATKREQTRNRSVAKNVTFSGITLPLLDWCERYGASYSMVHSRIFKHGWPLELALFAPASARRALWARIAWVPDDFPIRDPGDDARDESFSWCPAPEKVTA